MQDKILIVDFGSQYTQLIARRIRELNVYSEIVPFHTDADMTNVKGIILSGSPHSVLESNAPEVNPKYLNNEHSVLGICYGAQFIAKANGAAVLPSEHREYGRAKLKGIKNSPLFEGVKDDSQVWMSHGDSITELGDRIELIASTHSIPVAAYRLKQKEVYGIQFHPEVYHTTDGARLLKNFVVEMCGCRQTWTPQSYIESTVEELKEQLGNDQVVMGLSGGVDSTVAAVLLHRAIGKNLHCIFVDNGLLRKNEFESVLHQYKDLHLNVTGVRAGHRFLKALSGKEEPEAKRKAIGNTFIEVFDDEAHRIKNVKWLGQGTIYPDVIESVSATGGPSVTIKSHHNVGGLPDYMKLSVIEPLKWLFKDEVRRVGKALGLSQEILGRHPFPGPGLGIRILGEVTEEKVRVLQEVDHIYVNALKESALYDEVWQAAAILLPIQSVGVMGDERTYEGVVALRAVTSTDGMTADWCHLPYEFLSDLSNKIINKVKGVNRVVYDISSKPPSTIEWE
ncbi:MAG: glutamine-hydrolyzing GMP synthase [Vicingaceae bacterium]